MILSVKNAHNLRNIRKGKETAFPTQYEKLIRREGKYRKDIDFLTGSGYKWSVYQTN